MPRAGHSFLSSVLHHRWRVHPHFLHDLSRFGGATSIQVFSFIGICFHRNLFSATMRPHRRLGGNDHPLDSAGHVRDWAPPGWHWEVLPSGRRSLVRNQGPVVDPELIWWRSRGPGSVQREPAPEEVVRRRVREEDEHVRRYMVALDVRFSNTWQFLQGSHPSYDPVMVPSLWVFTARGSWPERRRPF